MTSEEKLDEAKNLLDLLLSKCSLGTRYVDGHYGRFVCPDCGAISEPIIRLGNLTPITKGAFDYVTHSSDCLFLQLINLLRS